MSLQEIFRIPYITTEECGVFAMKNSFSYLEEEEQNKIDAAPVNKAEHLFLDTLCTYFETEQILDKAQIERFRKIWLVQEKESTSKIK